MKKIRLIKALVGNILIVAIFLGLTGVAYGDVKSVKVDTGAIIWEVRVKVYSQILPMTSRWRGGHTTKSYYQSSGNNAKVKKMYIHALLWSSPNNKTWRLRDEEKKNDNDISVLTLETVGPLAMIGLLDKYGQARTVGYFQSYGGTVWSMDRPIGGKKPQIDDKHTKSPGA